MGMFRFLLYFGFLIIAIADNLIHQGSGDTPLDEGSGVSEITPNPPEHQGATESPADTVTAHNNLINNSSVYTPASETTGNQQLVSPAYTDKSTESAIIEISESIPEITRSVAEQIGEEMWNTATEVPIFSNVQDDRHDLTEMNASSPAPQKAFKLPTVESYDLSPALNHCLLTVVINSSVPAATWVQDSAENFSETVTSTIMADQTTNDLHMVFVAPSPYRTSTGLQISIIVSSCFDISLTTPSCCLDGEVLRNLLMTSKQSLEALIDSHIKDMYVGLPQEVLILGGLVRTEVWDGYTGLAATSVIVAAFLSVLLGMAIACTRLRRPTDQENVYKTSAYPIELGKNLASDEECKSSEYIISSKDDTVRRSISDGQQEPDEDDCTWVVPIEEIFPAAGREDIEDTKL